MVDAALTAASAAAGEGVPQAADAALGVSRVSWFL
jgi:hypothetical protein